MADTPIPALGPQETQLYPAESGKVNVTNIATVSGSFVTAGTGDPTNVRGRGFSVEYTDVGEYLITFANYYQECLYCNAHVGGVTPGTVVLNQAQVTPYVVATKTASINVFVSSTGVEGELTGPRIYFTFQFQLKNGLTNERDA